MLRASWLRWVRKVRTRGVAWLVLSAGCAHTPSEYIEPGDLLAYKAQYNQGRLVEGEMPSNLQQVGHHVTDNIAPDQPIPISLDAVFRLAETHNPRIALARERLHESGMDNAAACEAWFPRLTAGIGYYRHEGGIQNEDGTLTHSSTGAFYPGLELNGIFDPREAAYREIQAQRDLWQRKGELTKVSNEVLLEAATTYVDLLTAQQAEITIRQVEAYLLDLLDRARNLKTTRPDAGIMVEALSAEVETRRQAIAKIQQQGDAAAAKLAYLLHLGNHCQLAPVENQLVPIDLIDPTPPAEHLLAQAHSTGPGIHEMEGLLATIHDGIQRMTEQGILTPKICLTVNEGLFGAGPGGSMSFDNRLDVGVRAQWDITALLSAGEEKRRAMSKLRQAQLTYDELRAKLALGVQEARGSSLKGREQIQRGASAIQHAAETYLLSEKRLRLGATGSSIEEVQRTIRGLEEVHVRYIEAVNSYNKAQIRLLLLLGGGGHCQGTVTPTAVLPPAPAMPALPAKPKRDDSRKNEEKKEPAPQPKQISTPRAYPIPPELPDLK